MTTSAPQAAAATASDAAGEPGVTVRIAGGLGNQMFQYAAARALAVRLGVPLTLDLRFFDRGRHRRYGLDAMPLAPHAELGRQGAGRWARLLAPLRQAGRRQGLARDGGGKAHTARHNGDAARHVSGATEHRLCRLTETD